MSFASAAAGSRGYALAPVFCVRAAGVPFACLEALATPSVAAAARLLLAAELAVDREGARVIASAAASLGEDRRGARRALKRMVRNRRPITGEQRAAHPWLEAYGEVAEAHARAHGRLAQELEREALRVHGVLRRHALDVLPEFAVFESEAMLDELEAIAAAPPRTAPLRSSDRETDRSLAMYLQRVCAKNDTISRFGPSGWGRIVDGLAGLRIRPTPGIAARCIEVERWVVIGLIEAMNADPEVRAEVCPRRHPDALIEGGTVTRVDRDQQVRLGPEELALAARCDGETPAHRLGDPAALARLADAGVVRWELERFAVDASPLASLLGDVLAWRAGEVRSRWRGRLERLRELAAALGEAEGAARRRELIAGVRAELATLGVAGRDRGRTLYAAANPVSENCAREYGIELGAREAERLVTDAAPWFDLFHDAYALGVARAFDRYRALAVAAPRRAGGRLSYADLVAFARARGLDLDADAALVQIGSEAFAEVKRALGAALADRADAPEWELTAADCHVLRRLHDLPAVAELACPQADLQLAAASLEDLAAGRYTWVVAELHQAFTPLQHLLYWSCPDKPALHEAMAAAVGHQPFLVRGALTGQPVHIAGEAVFAALPKPIFVGRGRPKAGWRAVHPADTEVIVDEAARDIRLRAPGTGEDLGSLVRSFRLLMGMHPFFPFERAPHAPRLRLGDTVVQRRTWHLTSAELGEPRPIGLSPAFLTGIERIRRDRGVARWVFARPSAGSHRTYDVLARDKDLKPIYLDLESTLFLEILERRLRKYGELVLSEMLPSPDQLVWPAPDGRVVFELRTSVVPR